MLQKNIYISHEREKGEWSTVVLILNRSSFLYFQFDQWVIDNNLLSGLIFLGKWIKKVFVTILTDDETELTNKIDVFDFFVRRNFLFLFRLLVFQQLRFCSYNPHKILPFLLIQILLRFQLVPNHWKKIYCNLYETQLTV